MGERRVVSVLVALLAAIMFVVGGCGGNGAKPTGSDSDEPAPPEAQDAIVKGLQTMFTWYPARDASPRDAYVRALPYLGQKLQAGKDNTIERGNSVWWQEWKEKHAEVTATALLVAGEHPADQPDTVERSVLVTQTVKTPDGQVLDTTPMLIESVVAKKNPQGWHVEDINFFKTNQFRTPECPPGQSHQPAPDGPCAPNPPPPIQCPDGTAVPPDQTCPTPVTGPGNPTGPGTTTTKTTHQCPDGSTIPADQDCPANPGTTSQPPKECPDGTTVPADQTCPTPVTKECPGGTTVTGTQTCPPPTTCGDGSTVYSPTTCPSPTSCGDGSTVYAPTTCPSPTTCHDGSTVYAPTTCPSPTSCSDGSTVYAPTTCPPPPVKCADGSTVPHGQTCAPVKCPDGSSVPNGQTCAPVNCPDGSTVPNGQTCPPVIVQRPAAAPGYTCSPGGGILGPSCSCPQGWDYEGNNDGSNGKCVPAGPGPAVHFAPTVGGWGKAVGAPGRDVHIGVIMQPDTGPDPCATGGPTMCMIRSTR